MCFNKGLVYNNLVLTEIIQSELEWAIISLSSQKKADSERLI